MPEIETNSQETSYPLVCEICKVKNLTEPIHLMECLQCGSTICIHMASTIDSAYCHECMCDVQMTEQIVTKTTEHYDEDKDKVYVRTAKARQIQFSGLHWLFSQRQNKLLSDAELLLKIEYHQAIYHGLMSEREQRRIEHFHRNAGKAVIIKNTDGTSISTKTETTVKKTRTISPDKKTKAMANFAALLEQLAKQGKSTEEILAILGVK